jgi:hypothetical protein
MDLNSRLMAAATAIEAHNDATRNHDEDHETDVADLLTNLRHWCRAQDVDFSQAVRTSLMHYNAER